MKDKLKSHDINMVVDELVGDIIPIGETHHDDMAYDNLLIYIEVATGCLKRIYQVAEYHDRTEWSTQRSGIEALKYLSKLNTEISELCSEMLL